MSIAEISVKLANGWLTTILITLLLFNFDVLILISVIKPYEIGCFSMRKTAQNSSKLYLKGILQKNNRMVSNIAYKMINQ